MRRRVLAAGIAAIAIGGLLVVTGHGGSGTTGPDAVLRGHAWAGPHGVTESVADIAERQRAKDGRGGNRPVGVLEKPDPVELAEEGAAQGEEAGGEPAASGEEPAGENEVGDGDVDEKPTPGEPPQRPREQAPALRQALLGGSAIGPQSSFSTGTSFLGAELSDSHFIPPDSMGAVGPDQVLVDVNGRIRVFDKSGNPGSLDVTDAAFWSSVRSGAAVTDPGVEYDRLSGRWIVSAINTASTDNRVLIAISSGPTITNLSSFTFFSFKHNTPLPSHTGQFADYPQLGVDANAVYVGVNEFAGTTFNNSSVFVIPKSRLLSGGPLLVTGFQVASGTGPGPSSPQPATDMDPNVPAGYIVGADNLFFNRLDVLRITNPGSATPTISASMPITVPQTSFPLNVPAQGTNNTLDALDDRLFEAMIARGPNGSDSLWTAHNIAVNSSGVGSGSGNRDGARWYQIGDLSLDPPTVTQSGTLFDPAVSNPAFYWMPSIAMNGQGHASLNTNTAGVGQFAQVVSSGRLADDPLNLTQSADIIQSSSSPYDLNPQSGFTPNKRWGDYSQTVVDPTDNQTFWTFQEYANSPDSWGVQVIKLKAPPPATPSLATPDTVSLGQCSVGVEVTGTSAGGSGFFDPGQDPGGPGYTNHITASVTGDVDVNGVTYTDPTHITLDLDTRNATAGTQDITITNPDGQADTGTALLTTSGGPSGPTPPCLNDTDPDSPANNNSPSILGSADAGSTVKLYTDSSCTEPPVATGDAADLALAGIPVSVADDSNTTFWAIANDGVTDSACSATLGTPSGSVTYVEDSTPPALTIDTGPSGTTTNSMPTFTFTATDTVGPVTVECSIDTGTANFGVCSGPGSSDTPATALADGSYTFRVQATDAAGNSALATRPFTVQTPPVPPAPPVTPVTPSPNPAPDTAITKGPKKTTKRRPKFKFSSNQAGSSFQCQLDRGKFAPCTSPFQPGTKLSLGKHVLRVKAVGPTGLADASPAVRKFKVLP